MKRLIINIRSNLPPVLFILALILLWEAAGRLTEMPAYILPQPSAIVQSLLKDWPVLTLHLRSTIHATFSGLFLAIILALPLSVAMQRFGLLKRTLYPLLVISQTIPIIALAPLLMIWFGLGITPKIFVVALVCFFPLTLNITEGLDNVDPELLELMKVIRAGPWLVFRDVQLPAVLPYLFSGLKIAATYSVMAAVIGEWLGASYGLGIYMTRVMHSYNTAGLFASILLVVSLSLIIFIAVGIMERIFSPWKITLKEGEKE